MKMVKPVELASRDQCTERHVVMFLMKRQQLKRLVSREIGNLRLVGLPIEPIFKEENEGKCPRLIATLRSHASFLYCAWPETALLAKCEDRAYQGPS